MDVWLTEESIKEYHILKNDDEDGIVLEDVGVILKYKMYIDMEPKSVELINSVLETLVGYKFWDRTSYQGITGGVYKHGSWNAESGFLKYKEGDPNNVANVTPEEVYDFYCYYIRFKVKDIGTKSEQSRILYNKDAGYYAKIDELKNTYRIYGKRLYENVVYYCGHGKAYKILKEYDEIYFTELEGKYGNKYSKADKILLRTLYNARLWRLDKRCKILGKEKRYKIYKG